MKFKNITIAGGGTLGSQVAWQTAFSGFNVTVYDAFNNGIEASKQFHQGFAKLFMDTRGASAEQVQQALDRINYTTDLTLAVGDADLINESIPENIEIKKEFYKSISVLAPEKTIFTTNTSTTLPSDYAHETGRPEKFLALHFANGIWDANIGEVMGHSETDPEIFEHVVDFAKAIGMIPIPIHKEQNGYVINSLLGPFLSAAADLWVNDVSNYEDIDKTWMICLKTPIGPFGIMDLIGMQTIYNIETLWGEKEGDQAALKRAEAIKNRFLDHGKMGFSSGEGFYTYPNPKFEAENFIS